MAEIVVNFAALEEMATTLQNTRGQLKAHIDDLKSAMSPALAVWEGRDRDAYDPRQATLVSVCANMEEHLTNLKIAVIKVKEAYEANERHGVAMLR